MPTELAAVRVEPCVEPGGDDPATDCRDLNHTRLRRRGGARCRARRGIAHRRLRSVALGEHMTLQFDRPGMRERVIREVGDIYKGNVYFGEDLMEIPFGSPAPAKLD